MKFIPQHIKRYALTFIHIVLVIWVILLAYDWLSTYFENQKSTSYEQTPTSLRLKSKPEDVIYSEAKNTHDGKGEVKYAYLGDPVEQIPHEDIERRTSNSQTIVVDTKKDGDKKIDTLQTTFFSKPQFYKDKTGNWRHIEFATTTPEVFSASGAIPYVMKRELVELVLPGRPVFGQTSTFNPDANVETTSFDGNVAAYDGDAFCGGSTNDLTGFNNCRNVSTGTSNDDSATTSTASTGTYSFYGQFFSVVRAFLLFDTSSLPDDAIIKSATMSIYMISKTNTNDGSDTIQLVTTTPASNTAMAANDYPNVGSTAQATGLDITSVTTSAYNTFTLNATGLGNISKTGVTKFGIREGHDFSDVLPTGYNIVTYSSADQTGTSQDPKLDVTYTSGFSFGMWFPF